MLQRAGVSVVSAQRAARIDASVCYEVMLNISPVPPQAILIKIAASEGGMENYIKMVTAECLRL